MGRKLAILGGCAMLFLGTQVELAHTPSVEVFHNNQSLISAAVPTSPKIATSLRSDTSTFGLHFPEYVSTLFDLPFKFVTWSHNVKFALDMPTLQQNCLTTAVYFEARSESELGQLAVALVVLNRAEKTNSSICDVVYKGAHRFNSCQFSFACDGKPDVVNDTRAWKTSTGIANVAIAKSFRALSESMQVLTIATNYHADYVDPKWAKQLTRLAKIGRHVFYFETPNLKVAGSRKSYI